jgi:glycosyltransferase involved in cell wall biosynthesis
MSLPKRMLTGLPGKVVVRPSVPRGELDDIYRRASVLVFPSLCEGFGMVITEAMAYGVPVITTNNTGGTELIEHGRNGFLVPIRDAERLAASMQWCLDNREEVVAMGRRAQQTAAAWQWSDYRGALGRAVSEAYLTYSSVRGEGALLQASG